MKTKDKLKILSKSLNIRPTEEEVDTYSEEEWRLEIYPIKASEKAISLTEQQMKKEFLEIIEECKIHTHGALILIEKQELKSQIIGSQENQTGAPETTPQKCFDGTEDQTRADGNKTESYDNAHKASASGDNGGKDD